MLIAPFIGCHSGAAEYPSLLGCDAVCLGEWSATFRNVRSASVFKCELIFVQCCKHYDNMTSHPVRLESSTLFYSGEGVGQVEPKSTFCAEQAEF